MIQIEFFDIARARAGRPLVTVAGTTLRDALVAAAQECPGLVPDVLSADGDVGDHWLVSRDGREFLDDPETPLADGDKLLILSALAGG